MKSFPVAAENSAPPPAGPPVTAKVLVVDDEALVRWSLKERLTQAGCCVLEADTGDVALALSADDIDVVLLDCRLPDATGLAVLRTIKARHPDTQVILMTAYSSLENAADAIALGACDYIAKPFDLDVVVGMVNDAVATPRLLQE